jgi:hypothetical protein
MVFIGRAVGVWGTRGPAWNKDPEWTRSADSVPYFQDRVVLVVEEGWSGTPPDTVRATVELTGPDCPTRFVPGQRYLVFADLESSGYLIGACTRTSEITSEAAQRDLKALGQPRWHRN